MAHVKVKSKPPPLRLACEEGLVQGSDTFSFKNVIPKDEAPEDNSHCGSTLIGLLTENDVMPFNLHTAASLGLTPHVRHLIERCNICVSVKNNGNWTALMYASLFSHDDTVLYLLEMKANVNEKNPNGKTPLMLASLCGNNDTVRLLLQHGAHLEERDNDDFTALMLAIQATHCETAQLLLDFGANPNIQEKFHGQTPLYIAAQTGQFAIARTMILKGIDVDVRTSSGDTAYHVALRNGYTALADLIVEREQHKLPMITVSLSRSNSKPVTTLPTRFKPKSPYSNFFDRFNTFTMDGKSPEIVSGSIDEECKQRWYLYDDDFRYSPDGVESTGENFNPFNAWPGTSVFFKEAIGNKLQISFPKQHKMEEVDSCKIPSQPWGIFHSDVCNNDYNCCHKHITKFPKDLSTLLADLGLTKYKIHFEEHDVNLQVFLTMNETDLREIGIKSLGALRQCLAAIERYRSCCNFFRIGEQSTSHLPICKHKLAELKIAWEDAYTIVQQLDNEPTSHLFAKLMKRLQQINEFFANF